MKKVLFGLSLISCAAAYGMDNTQSSSSSQTTQPTRPTFGKLINKNVYGALIALKKKLSTQLPVNVIINVLNHYLEDTTIDRLERLNIALEFIADPKYNDLYNIRERKDLQTALIDKIYTSNDLAFGNHYASLWDGIQTTFDKDGNPIQEKSPLEFAKAQGYDSEILAKLSPRDSATFDSITDSLKDDQFETVQHLFEDKQVDPRIKSRQGRTLLDWACFEGPRSHNNYIQAIINLDINTDGEQDTLLMIALAQPDRFGLITKDPRILMAYEQNNIPQLASLLINRNTNKEMFLAIIAMGLSHGSINHDHAIQWINYLVDHGLNTYKLMQKNLGGDKCPALDCLVNEPRFFPVVEALLARGVSLNIRDENGNTILMRLVLEPPHFFTNRITLLTCVDFMINHGADLTLKNKAGKTALDIARENGYPTIANRIEQALATQAQNNLPS